VNRINSIVTAMYRAWITVSVGEWEQQYHNDVKQHDGPQHFTGRLYTLQTGSAIVINLISLIIIIIITLSPCCRCEGVCRLNVQEYILYTEC